jgi:hypothetical protein
MRSTKFLSSTLHFLMNLMAMLINRKMVRRVRELKVRKNRARTDRVRII